MGSDQSRMVRAAAAGAVLERRPSWALATAVQSAVRIDADEGVRLSALRAAIKWTPLAPMLRETIQWAADHDRNESLRKMAGKALGRLEKTG